MKILTILALFFALLGKAFAHDPATDMATAAQRFILSLDDKAKKEAVFSWKDKERERWHFVPGNFIKPNGKRLGLTLGNMKPAQRTLAHALLASALSHRGHLEASTIMILEQILFEMEGRDIRDPYLYHVCIFGKPDASGTWGWRFEDITSPLILRS